ncbi:hypothetical protein [Nitrososphaera viennensis]|uniref:Roadblock/LAMTOR2 domain-containing protein n=2 Tax=Nitrososphaera viennensis TaxID=1034015 RepID=A0A060HEF4_9ARCH|nr:hypothetical protein [Nitrososphaera viennensis]AIC15049.1 hypothetical protein NVIE_008310 [Nitrososphaera viennensis EN76]UVS69978.1 hypothetical protein NWT39_04125 [Nitrososphaera viennensis]
MDHASLCKAVAALHGNIQAAVVVSNGEMIARHVRQGVPIPPTTELEKLFMRAEVFVGMTKQSDHLFGRTGYVMTNHEMLDTFIFSIPDNSVLILPIVNPYNHDELLDKVGSLLGVKFGW